MILVAGRKTH